MALPFLSTANATLRVAQYQGTLDVPLFDPPYSMVEIPLAVAGAALSPHSWFPLLRARAGTGGMSPGFVALLPTPFQYSKFQYNPTAITDTWGDSNASGLGWYGNKLMVPAGVSSTRALVAQLTAAIGGTTTYNNAPFIYNYFTPSTLIIDNSALFVNGDGFGCIGHVGAETGADYTLYATSIFGNFIKNNPGGLDFSGSVAPKYDLMTLADLGPTIFYSQPVFDKLRAANWYFFSRTNFNWVSGNYVASIPMTTLNLFTSLVFPTLYKVSFDDPYIDTRFATAFFNPTGGNGWAGNFSKGHIWIANVNDSQFGQSNTIVVLNTELTRYWRIRFIPQSANAVAALAANVAFTVKIDPLGVFYFKGPGITGNTNLRRMIFTSQGFNFSFQFPTSNLSFNGLPCMEPCAPYPGRS